MTLFPINVWLPIAVQDAVASVTLPEAQEIARITGSLQALSSGTLVTRVRDEAGNLIGTLSWSSAGNRSVVAASFPSTTRLDFDITSAGTGAVGLYISVWCNPSAREAPVYVDTSVGLSADLVSLWKMEEASGTRYDSVGSNHLTDNNTVTAAAGKLGDAGQFVAANNEYLSIPDNAFLRVGGMSTHWYTWIYLDSLTAARTVAGKRQTANEWATEVQADGSVRFYSYHGGLLKNAISGAGAITTGVWYFLDWYFDSANSLIGIAINNGAPFTAATGGAAQDGGSTTFCIGSNGISLFFDGRIDAFGWWSRLLTSTERTALYNGGAGLPYPFVV